MLKLSIVLCSTSDPWMHGPFATQTFGPFWRVDFPSQSRKFLKRKNVQWICRLKEGEKGFQTPDCNASQETIIPARIRVVGLSKQNWFHADFCFLSTAHSRLLAPCAFLNWNFHLRLVQSLPRSGENVSRILRVRMCHQWFPNRILAELTKNPLIALGKFVWPLLVLWSNKRIPNWEKTNQCSRESRETVVVAAQYLQWSLIHLIFSGNTLCSCGDYPQCYQAGDLEWNPNPINTAKSGGSNWCVLWCVSRNMTFGVAFQIQLGKHCHSLIRFPTLACRLPWRTRSHTKVLMPAKKSAGYCGPDVSETFIFSWSVQQTEELENAQPHQHP